MNAITPAVLRSVVQRSWNWRVFWTLEVAAALAVVALLPYALTLQGPVLKQYEPPIPLAVLVPPQILQSAILIGAFIAMGMWIAPKVGLGTPLLDEWTSGEPGPPRLLRTLAVSALWGGMASVLVIFLDTKIFAPHLPHVAHRKLPIPPPGRVSWPAFTEVSTRRSSFASV
jgi:hypothetical protein